jgi:pimeloyl-ACP methyl ester carboxylesterase
MGGWIAMNHAIYAPYRLRRLVLLGPMGLPAWRTTLAVLIPFAWYRVRPTEAKFDRIIFRSLGEGARANREFRQWMQIMGQAKPLVGQPINIPARNLAMIKSRTLGHARWKGWIDRERHRRRETRSEPVMPTNEVPPASSLVLRTYGSGAISLPSRR